MRAFLLLLILSAVVFVSSCNKHAVTPEHVPSAADSIDFIDSSVFSCKIDGWMFVPQAAKPKLFGPDIRPLSVFFDDTLFYVDAEYYMRNPESIQNIHIVTKFPRIGRFRFGNNYPIYLDVNGDRASGVTDSTSESYLYIDSYDPVNKKSTGHFECLVYDENRKRNISITEGKFNFDFSKK